MTLISTSVYTVLSKNNNEPLLRKHEGMTPQNTLGTDMAISNLYEQKALDIIGQCLSIRDLNGVQNLILLLQEQLDIYGCILGCKEKYERNLVDESFITSYGISPEWLEIYKSEKLDTQDPVAHTAFQTEHPILWGDVYQEAAPTAKDFISLSRDYRLMEGLSCATQSNRFNGAATCVSVIFDHTALEPPQISILERILPHLNESIAQPGLSACAHFTPREIEILKWVQAGKSNWEIGMIVAISERTVKFHLNNIYRKLDVHTRTQAIARAIKLGIISL